MMIRSQRARDDAEREERLAPPNEMRGSRMAGEESLTYDAATRSVEAVFSTGAAVKRWGFIEELEVSTEAIDLGRVEKGLCRLLDTHNAYELDAVLGSVSEVRIENGELAFPVSEVTIASNLKDMFQNMVPASDIDRQFGTAAPTLLVEGMTLAGE